MTPATLLHRLTAIAEAMEAATKFAVGIGRFPTAVHLHDCPPDVVAAAIKAGARHRVAHGTYTADGHVYDECSLTLTGERPASVFGADRPGTPAELAALSVVK